MSKVDLHIHSHHSDDGEFSAADIIGLCENKRMHMIAVTDHNSVKGVSEAIALGKEKGIRVIAGVELDCVYEEMNFHLLGYDFAYDRDEFSAIEDDIFKQEMEAASEKMYKFTKATGITIKENDVFDAAGGKIVTGELIAEIVLGAETAGKHDCLKPYLQGGAKSDMPYVHFYWDFFSKDKPAYVPIRYISLNEAVALIHRANGVAVLAHPGQNLKHDFSFVDKIIKEGIDGLEVFSSYHEEATTQFFYQKAREHRLMATCGSDFHGKNKPHIQIGDCRLSIDEQAVTGLFR